MMSPSDYESLSREERIRRIGAILGKAVTCVWSASALPEKAPVECPRHPAKRRHPAMTFPPLTCQPNRWPAMN